MKKQILLALFFSISYLGLTAQCNQPFPPALTCADAPIICDLDGYCTTLITSNEMDEPTTFCGDISNNHWFGFVAGSTSISLEVIVANCMGTGNGTGLQAQVFSQCGAPWTPASNCIYEISPFSSDILTMNNLTVGNIYYIMTDGFSNDICDYTVEVISGSTTAPIPDPAGPITGDTEYCPGASNVTYCVPQTFGAALFEWTVPIGSAIVGSNNGNCITIDFGGTIGMGGTITATPTNGCEVGVPSSLTVTQGPTPTNPDVYLVFCEGDVVTFGNTTYSAWGTFLNTDLINSQGCAIETIVHVQVITAQSTTTYLNEVVCEGGVSSTGEVIAGVYTYHYSSNGCDSTVILDLTVLNPISGIFPVTDSINFVGDVVKLEAVVILQDPSISYIWTGPCVDPNASITDPFVEVSCGGVYELQVSQTVGGVTCLSPIYTVTVIDNTIIVGGCPDDFVGFTTLGEFGGSKYYISNDNMQPVEGQTLVESLDGYLVAIGSQEENDFIQENISEMVYIGLNDYDTEGELVWGNSEALIYNNINPCGFCNENSEEQDFVIIAPWDGAWSFSNFYNSRKIIMEVPCGITPPMPEITIDYCSPHINIVLSNGAVTTIIDYDYPSASTTCPGGDVTIEKLGGPDIGDTVGEGAYDVVFEVTDTCGNMEICSFTIEVKPEVIIGDCPDDIAGFTTLGEYGNSKYYVSNDVSRPTDAQAEAESHGGYLVSISSQEENDFVQQNISDMVYIGLNDYDSEGDLVWFNNEPLVYDNINPCGDCNENSEEQDFVIIAPWNGTWSFSNFYNNRKYVMEIPCSSTLTNPNIGNSFTSQTSNQIEKPQLESLVPNPASDFIFAKINTSQEEEIEIMIYDAMGVLVKTERMNLIEGINSQRIDIANLENGFYTIYIPQAELKFATQRFVKVMN